MTDEETAREACFEAGIKLGALYHQFVGTPVSRGSVGSLEDAVEGAVESQRYVVDAEVSIDGVEHNRFGYDELKGTMLDVRVTIEKDGVVVEATVGDEDGYPMMRIDEVRDV
ncbi:MAG: dihydroneopterin aldolase family protein [Halobacteriales archaeon]